MTEVGRPGIGRRSLIAGGAATGAALALSGLFDGRADAAETPLTPAKHRYQQPNIVFLMVDEMRYPREFPADIQNAEQFLATFMPNLHQLWASGVKFANHYTTGTACSPARATFVTGLYPLQQWLLQTRTGSPSTPVPSPALGRFFPTYGKLLRQAGYRTPYTGKWHLSPSPDEGTPAGPGYLQEYGFEGLTEPDILGDNGDGVNFDGKIAAQAASWLQTTKPGQQPFCLTVSFVNPHDKQFFWAGTEAARYNQLYADHDAVPQRSWSPVPQEATPQRYGFSPVPANWESEVALSTKPTTQKLARDFQSLVWGGVTDDQRNTDTYALRNYGSDPTRKVAYAPWGYWERALDSYTQVQSMVDEHIGTVLRAVPPDVARNTVFVMMSDHGEYAGAHGMVSGKLATAYDEAFSIPLIVADPRGLLTGDTDQIRQQLTSSVDIVPMMASIGYGDRSWMTGEIAKVYAERLDLLPLLASNRAQGRSHVVMATNEHAPKALNAGNDPTHIYILRTHEYKVAAYARWVRNGPIIDPRSLQYEFYDYATERGRLELDNTFDHDRRARAAARELLTRNLHEQLAQPLPGVYGRQSAAAEARYLNYIYWLDTLTDQELNGGGIARLTSFGGNF